MIIIQEELTNETHLYGWKSEPPLTPFAPNYAYYLTDKKIFSEEECKEWNTYLLEQEQILLDKFRISLGEGGTGLGIASITSRYNFFNVLGFDFYLVSKLKKALYDGIKTILSVSDNTNWYETLYGRSWFNVLRKEEAMDTHSHGYHKNSFYGFHVTISATETFTSYYHPVKFQEVKVGGTFHVPNKIGNLTLFPNHIPHSVSTNRYETPRISIAGDINSSTWLDEFKDYPTKTANLVEIGTYNSDGTTLPIDPLSNIVRH